MKLKPINQAPAPAPILQPEPIPQSRPNPAGDPAFWAQFKKPQPESAATVPDPAPAPAPAPVTRLIPPTSWLASKLIQQGTRAGNAPAAIVDKIIDKIEPTILSAPIVTNQKVVRSALVEHDFPFDESQLAAIDGMVQEKHACLTGSAGTGKTTVTKAFVQRIHDDLGSVDMTKYFRKSKGVDVAMDDADDYEIPEDKLVSAIALCSFTGKASQMIKKNFPSDWHGNIFTIHRMLGFYPEPYEEFDPEINSMVNKRRFVPYYTADNKMPWKVILIDEAGMLGLDLWHMLLDACESDTRIYMIGDINQLPPVHGKSIFGFAMSRWPTWELTTIHRQKGKNNSIVDNAWNVINGRKPISDDLANPDWKFAALPFDVNPIKASKQLRKWISIVREQGIFNELRDVIITPINAENETAGGELGQIPLNEELALMFHGDDHRYVIDAGRERKRFALGDRIMATKNDYELNVTNGMMGRIISIEANGKYQGDTKRFGRIPDVNAYMASYDDQEDVDFSLEMLAEKLSAKTEKTKRDSDRGPSSHIVTVDFGTDKNPHVIAFDTFSSVAQLVMSYAVTCHKMQGGEAHLVVVIVHQAHKRMLHREWLYTAITRAQERCVVLYTDIGLANAVSNQKIKGKTLPEKIASFQKLIDPNGLLGVTINVRLPIAAKAEGHES